MKCADVMKFCQALPDSQQHQLSGQETEIQFSANGNPFALFHTGAPIQWQFTLAVTPDQQAEMVSPPRIRTSTRYPGTWVTIARVENYDDEALVEMIVAAYHAALKGEAVTLAE